MGQNHPHACTPYTKHSRPFLIPSTTYLLSAPYCYVRRIAYELCIRTDYKEHGQAQAKKAGRSLYGVRITLRDTDASDATIRGRVT